ncbi:NACHT domain-containing protein [Dendronalium sp. ChiSLP03b]|uniref:NACHT domain-containing protein n=1 Tax=Dendronalium sp. ChiSLP03b TaxID=3075381 RepID=UPI002AD47432|nr:NACHT domain-containing protein [Dendronalium sp. ChiSLP03b]MDZ8209236.1 NACHT domain-containing protein [Dendronalium sp. ChiSLP03b]
MGKRLYLKKRFQRQRNRLFVSIFALALTLTVLFGSAVPTYTQTPKPIARDAVITEIKAYAQRHVDNDSPLKTEFVVNQYRDNKVGLTAPEIAKIYEEEYTKQKQAKESSLQEQLLPKMGWVAAGFLFLVLIFRDVVTEWVKNFFNAIGTGIYNRFAGSKLFRGIALRKYQKGLIDKYQELHIPFRPHRPLKVSEVYVPLKVKGASNTEQIDAYHAVNEYPRLMVTGDPGSGKSMLLKHLALSYAEARLYLPEQPILVLLELHRLSDAQKSLEQLLVDALARDNFPHAEHFVDHSLKQGTLMLLFDGLDEVNSSDRWRVVQQIKDILDQHPKCRVVITCRKAVYRGEFAEVVDRTLEVVEFSDRQIRHFLGSWKRDMPADKSIEQLMQTLHDRPRIMALARNPLMLTIVAYLYTDTRFVLPHSRAEFYRKSTDILLDQWHQEHNRYQARDKRLVLQHLALYNQDSANYQQQDRRSLKFTTVLEQVRQILPGLNLQPDQDALPLLKEIVERSGLLLEIDGGDKYQFAHLTLQEFFAAAELIDKADDLFNRFQTDKDAWRETVKLWCGIAGDSTALLQKIYIEDEITAFECLADAQKVDQALATQIINSFKVQLGTVSNTTAVEEAFGAVAADSRPRGEEVLEFLTQTLATSQEPARRLAAANALSFTNLPDAAQVLANNYGNCPEARTALIRMGDLAVSALAYLVAGSTEAMDDLLTIGTPDAAKALVPLLWKQDDRIAARAAWRLAALLHQPNVEDELRNYSLTEEQRRADKLDWIWQPFDESASSAVSLIAGRVAYLMEKAPIEVAPTTPPELDPRLVIPLCSIPLIGQMNLSALKKEKPTPELVEIVDELFHDSAPQLVENIKSQNGFYRFHAVQEVTNLLTIPSTQIPQSSDVQAQFIKEVLKTTKASPRSCYLWAGLTSNMKCNLLHCLLKADSTQTLTTYSDWLNIFQPIKYKFDKSWHYLLIITLLAIISIIALGMIGNFVLQSSILLSWNNGFLLIITIPIIGCFYLMLTREESRKNVAFMIFNNNIYDDKLNTRIFKKQNVLFDNIFCIIILVIPILSIVHVFVLINDFRNKSLEISSILFLPFSYWSPAVIYLIYLPLLQVFTPLYVLFVIAIIFLILIVICSLLIWLAQKRDREARNPLQGILEAKTSSTSSNYLISKSLFRLGRLRFWYPKL